MFVAQLYHNTTLVDTAALSFSVSGDTISPTENGELMENKENEEIDTTSSLASITGYAVYQHAAPFETTFYKTIALLNAVLLGVLFSLILYVTIKNRSVVKNALQNQSQAI